MNPTLAPEQSTSPDLRLGTITPLPATDEAYQVLDMQQVQEELAAALRHIENLRPDHPSP